MTHVLVFDFDGVLFNQTKQLYPGVVELLQKYQHWPCAIATRRSGEGEVAEMTNVLREAGVLSVFACIIADSRPKTYHLEQIKLRMGSSAVCCLIDDWHQNIRDVQCCGYLAVECQGLSERHIEDAIRLMRGSRQATP